MTTYFDKVLNAGSMVDGCRWTEQKTTTRSGGRGRVFGPGQFLVVSCKVVHDTYIFYLPVLTHLLTYLPGTYLLVVHVHYTYLHIDIFYTFLLLFLGRPVRMTENDTPSTK